MSTINNQEIEKRLTNTRLSSYLAATNNDLSAAIRLYDWNIQAGAALHEDISRLEVIFRNAVSGELVRLTARRGWTGPWFDQQHLFNNKAWQDIGNARQHASSHGRRTVTHGRLVAELNFGFWRYLCSSAYLTSLWVPALASAFPGHPSAAPQTIRADVNRRMTGLHALRNRIAHHEPIHSRNLRGDHHDLLDVIEWICPHSHAWVTSTSRTTGVLNSRP